MKYKLSVNERKELAPPVNPDFPNWVGRPRDYDHPNWPDYNVFRRKVIDNGGLDSTWGPFDSVVPLEVDGKTNEFVTTTVVYNTLEAIQEFYSLIVDSDNNPRNPGVYYVAITEIEDDGTDVRIVQETNSLPYYGTNLT